MRRWLLVLMIALLPIRGWMGDAMAGGMAAAQLNVTNSIAAHAEPARAAAVFEAQDEAPGHADCHGKAAMVASAEAPISPASPAVEGSDACGSCMLCQVCHTVALAVPVAQATPVQHHHMTPPAMGQRFASAELAPGFKPPIS